MQHEIISKREVYKAAQTHTFMSCYNTALQWDNGSVYRWDISQFRRSDRRIVHEHSWTVTVPTRKWSSCYLMFIHELQYFSVDGRHLVWSSTVSLKINIILCVHKFVYYPLRFLNLSLPLLIQSLKWDMQVHTHTYKQQITMKINLSGPKRLFFCFITFKEPCDEKTLSK